MTGNSILGIMSGTSIDSVDFAVCAVSGGFVRLKKHWQVKFPAPLRRRLHAAASGRASSWEVGQLHHDLGRFYALGAKRGLSGRRVALIGLHGQTIFHQPARDPATFQLGEPAYLAHALGTPVVSNFRAADIAVGGQGAPLATKFHVQVFGGRRRHVCVNNLGGISNVTSIDWREGKRPAIVAFDTGPGNMLLDLAMRHFTGGKLTLDKNGAWAARGKACEPLLKQWLKLKFFQQSPPKSTGREMFGEMFFQRVLSDLRGLSRFDVLATLTGFTARSLALTYKLHLPAPPERVILCGGGAANSTLVQAIYAQLRQLNPGSEVLTADQIGWPLQSIEPAAFALLAWLRWNGEPGNIPETTGARRALLCGQISEP